MKGNKFHSCAAGSRHPVPPLEAAVMDSLSTLPLSASLGKIGLNTLSTYLGSPGFATAATTTCKHLVKEMSTVINQGFIFVRRLQKKKKWVNEGGGSHKGEDRLTSCAGTRCLYSTWNPRSQISHPPCAGFDSLQTCSIRLPFPTKTHRESNQ